MSTQPVFQSSRSYLAPTNTEAAIRHLTARLVEMERRIGQLESVPKITPRARSHQIIVAEIVDKSRLAMQVVCDEFSVMPETVLALTGQHRIARMRRLFMRLLREQCNYTFAEIGTVVNRHHSTVMYAIVDSRKRDEEIYARLIARLQLAAGK